MTGKVGAIVSLWKIVMEKNYVFFFDGYKGGL